MNGFLFCKKTKRSVNPCLQRQIMIVSSKLRCPLDNIGTVYETDWNYSRRAHDGHENGGAPSANNAKADAVREFMNSPPPFIQLQVIILTVLIDQLQEMQSMRDEAQNLHQGHISRVQMQIAILQRQIHRNFFLLLTLHPGIAVGL